MKAPVRNGAFLFFITVLLPTTARAAQAERAVSALALVSLEYDSNVLREPETSVSAPAGRDDFSHLLFMFVETSSPRRCVTGRFNAFSKDYRRFHDLDMLGLSGGVECGFQGPVARWSAGYQYQHYWLEQASFLAIHALEGRLRIGRSTSRRLDLTYRLSTKGFRTPLADLDGRQHDVSAAWRSQDAAWWRRWEGKLRGTFENSGRREAIYRGVSVEAAWKPLGPRDVELALRPSLRYRRYEPAQAGRREDWLQSASVRVSRLFSRRWLAEVEYRWERNLSSREVFRYRKSVVSTSVALVL